MLSYSRGHDAPLIEASIWEVFERNRFADFQTAKLWWCGIKE